MEMDPFSHAVQSARNHPFTGVDLPASNLLALRYHGKVREVYQAGLGRLLLVTTDRLSAFDRILGVVPYKGQVLNQLSAWWFDQLSDILPAHMITLPDPNAVLVHETRPLLVEVVVRAYLTGVTSTALWHRYSLGERTIYGHHFPDGLRKNEPLPKPMITPTTKGGPTGHDERLTLAEVVEKGILDPQTWEQVQEAALQIFARGQALAARAGLTLVDTKYEFGLGVDGRLMLIDEVHTPDSSRFWRAESYAGRVAAGQEPENFDKEFIRLAFSAAGYQGEGEPPQMPASLWLDASQYYRAVFEMLTGQAFQPAPYPVGPRLAENLRKTGLI